MQLTLESYRTRWLVLVTAWTLAGTVLWTQGRLVEQYLNLASQIGLRGLPAPQTPLQQVYPSFAADAQMWVRHAVSLTEGNGPQLRYTNIDNAPDGREVHWNSAWAWCIAGAGWLHHLFTGLPLPTAIERATLWLNPLLMLACIIGFSAWVTSRAGALAGVIIVIAITGHDRFLEGFFPTYVDHHGLLTAAVFGLILGAVFMGAGWWQPRNANEMHALPASPALARSAAVFSAFSGACGLWVSAASVIPPIAIVGICGLVAVIVQGRHASRSGAVFDPEVWRLWGRVGAGLSLLFYLLEYFPSHMAFRLEPNHPLHALAWLGGGELIAAISERWLGPPEQRWARPTRLIWPLVAISAVPVVVLIGGASVFSVFDKFMSRLHSDYIQEFLPMWQTLRTFDKKGVFHVLFVGSLPLLAAIATLTYRRRDNPIVLWFATFVACALTVMAWWQSRWLLNVAGALVCVMLLVCVCWTWHYRPLIRWIAGIGIAGALFFPSLISRYTGSVDDIKSRRVSPKDAIASLNRDIAAAIRASQPEGEITLLTSPNSSVGVGYFGRFKTLGTLYWENAEGLKAAASILAAPTERQAATLIRAHKVTHVAIISEENFILPYYQLLNPDSRPEQGRTCFGNRLLLDKIVPQWLQMIPYRLPDDLKALNVTVLLFKVNFKQSLAEAIYNVALAQVAGGAVEEAVRTLDVLVKQAPHLYQPWLRKGELLLARQEFDAALEHTMKGISLAPPGERPALYAQAGQAFYSQHQHAAAIRLYRAALAEKYFADIACYLAWILSTSPTDALRDGTSALQLTEQALKLDPNSPTFLSARAAALAELGRFPEAVAVGERAVVNARLRKEGAMEKLFAERLAVLKTSRPLRN